MSYASLFIAGGQPRIVDGLFILSDGKEASITVVDSGNPVAK
jgi:hypothetical protein